MRALLSQYSDTFRDRPFLLRTPHASLPWLCMRLDFYAQYTQKFTLTRPLHSDVISSEIHKSTELVTTHRLPPTAPILVETPREYPFFFLPCGHLSFDLAVTAQNDEFKAVL